MLLGSSIMTNTTFKGYLDDVTIHEQTLTDEQVQSVYNASLNSVTPKIPLNQWSHITVNHNKHQKRLETFINGELAGVYDNFNGNVVEPNSNDILLGQGFVGEMSEVVLFNRPLTRNEVKALATDPKRHQKSKELLRANFAGVESISKEFVFNKTSGEDDLTLRSVGTYKAGHTDGARALKFNGTQMATLNLSNDGFVFDNLVLQAKVNFTNTTNGTKQSLVTVPGVFDWYVGVDGQLTFKMEGDNTEYKQDKLPKNNLFQTVQVSVNKYNSKIEFGTLNDASKIDITLNDGNTQAMNITTDDVTDADATKTPWILVLNYVHKGGTNPELNARDTTKGFPVLPKDGSLDFDNVDINGTIEDGSVSDPDSWGHTSKDLFDKLCKALGSDTANNNGVELRFVAKTNHHTRIIDFKSHWASMISEFRTGNQSGGAIVWPTDTYTKYSRHNASIPSNDSGSRIFNEPTTGDNEMTEFPFFGLNAAWAMRGQGNRWEVDNYDANTIKFTYNTYHQIWVRANNTQTNLGAPVQEIPNVAINMNTNNVMYVGSNLVGSMSEVKVGLGYYVAPEEDYTQTKQVLNFSFDESSTEVAKDTSSLANHGTIMNGATRQYGTYDIQSKGLKLDASQDQYVRVPGAAYNNVSFSTSTMSAWVYTSNDGTAADKKSILRRDGAFEWYIDGTGVVKYMDLKTYEGVTSATTVANNTWTHLAIVINEFTDSFTFYKDGTLVDTQLSALPIVIPISSNDIHIGKSFTGVLDNVIIHLGTLNVTEEEKLYAVPDNSYTPQTIANDEWTHVACVYKQDTNTITVYHNGQVIGYYNNYLQDFTSVGKNVNHMLIASTGDNVTFFDGIMDDLRIYKTALTEADINEMFNQYKFYKRYFNIQTSMTNMVSFNLTDPMVVDAVLYEPEGKTANNTVMYYAFAATRQLNGRSEVMFLLENLDSINVDLYNTHVYTTTGTAHETAWNTSITKVLAGNLVDEAVITDTLHLYVYVVAKDYEGNVDYIYKQVVRELPVLTMNVTAAVTESNTIAMTSGSVVSAKQYMIFAFAGQISLDAAKTFAKTKIAPGLSTATGGTMNTVGGHKVYSYKVSTTLPTPSDHLIATGITLSNAFDTTTSIATTPVPITAEGVYTTYVVAVDTTNTHHVTSTGVSYTASNDNNALVVKHTPIQSNEVPPTIPLSVKFDITEPTAEAGVTIPSGELVVGTTVPIVKVVAFVVSGNIKGKNTIKSFYTNNLKDITESSDTIYVNTTGYGLGTTLDLSILNIALTKMYTGIDSVSDAVITIGDLYNVYIVTVNLNGEIESGTKGVLPHYDSINVNYGSVQKVTGTPTWFSGAYYQYVVDISTDGQYMATPVIYKNNSLTPISKPGELYIAKNVSAPGEDIKWSEYQYIVLPSNAGFAILTDTSKQSHVNNVSLSHDGTFLAVAGNNWTYVYKRNDNTNQYELYDEVTTKFSQVTLNHPSDNGYYTISNRIKLSATGDYLFLMGGRDTSSKNITFSVWVNNGSGYELYQDGGFEQYKSNVNDLYFGISADGQTVIVSGSKQSGTPGLNEIGFRVYKRNDDLQRYEQIQYARYANYGTGVETEENTNEEFVAQTGGASTIGQSTPSSGWVQGAFAKITTSYDGKMFVIYGHRNQNGYNGLCAIFKWNPDTNIYNHIDDLTMANSTLGISYNNNRSGCGNEQGSYYPGGVSMSTDGRYVMSHVWNESPGYFIFKFDDATNKYMRQKTIQTGGCVRLDNAEASIYQMDSPLISFVVGSGEYVYLSSGYVWDTHVLKPTGAV